MTQPYPPDRYLQGNFAPLRMECDLHDVIVEGEVPRELCGTYYRNGPDPQYPPREDGYHWFMGDGMVHAFAIESGRVAYRNRWMRTKKFEFERAAGRSLFGLFGNPFTSEPEVVGQPFNLANTSVIAHAGRLFALEEGNPPFEFDPRTLESRGSWTFQGALQGPMTAHPKIDPETGECLFFGYMADGPGTHTVSYHVADRAGSLTRAERFENPYCAMMHDFLVTKQHVVFPVMPLTLNIERAIAGGPPLAWEPSLGARLGVLRRDAGIDRIRWFQGDPSFFYHSFNAQTVTEDGRAKIIADVLRYDRPPLFPTADGAPTNDREVRSALVRWTIDLDDDNGTWTERPLSDLAGEFPRIDERRAGLSYRYGYMGARAPSSHDLDMLDSIARIDFTTGQTELWTPGEGATVGEPVFVPRSASAPEGDGWLIALVFRAGENRSDLVILRAGDLRRGPVATLKLPHRIPYGFHGQWVGA